MSESEKQVIAGLLASGGIAASILFESNEAEENNTDQKHEGEIASVYEI